jgi:plastocyanin
MASGGPATLSPRDVAQRLLAMAAALRSYQLVNKFTNSDVCARGGFEVNTLAIHWRPLAMRFNGLVLAAAFAAMSGCGGGDRASSDTGAAAQPAPGTTTGSVATTGTAAAPATGTVHEVRMVGDERGYRYEPTNITVKAGDAIKWVMVSGAPHNVAFQNVPADARAQLSANMPNQISDLSSPMFLNPNETYQVSFAGVKPGRYEYICTPHIANNMRGTVTVQ